MVWFRRIFKTPNLRSLGQIDIKTQITAPVFFKVFLSSLFENLAIHVLKLI